MKISSFAIPLLKQAVYQGISDEESVLEYAVKIARFEKHKVIEPPDMGEAIQYRFEEKAEDGMYYVNTVFADHLFDKKKRLDYRERRFELGITKKMNLQIDIIYDKIKNIIFNSLDNKAKDLFKYYVETQMDRNLTVKDLTKILRIISNADTDDNGKIRIEDLAFSIQKYA